ncbi:curlin, partial [Microbaculum marinum]
MTRTFFIATAIATTLGLSAVPAMANSVYLNQYGWGNAAGGAQAGHNNTIGIHQNGIFNGAVSQQQGKNNLSAIGQNGFNNSAGTWQKGKN